MYSKGSLTFALDAFRSHALVLTVNLLTLRYTSVHFLCFYTCMSSSGGGGGNRIICFRTSKILPLLDFFSY